MTVVIDASALAAALVDSGPHGAWAESLIEAEDLVVPELALAETSNILRRLEQSGDIPRIEATGSHHDLMRLDMELFPFAPFAERIWALRGDLTCYDAWYMAVAEALECLLATVDGRLTRAGGPACLIICPPNF